MKTVSFAVVTILLLNVIRFKWVDCEIATALANSNGGQDHVINLSVVACGDRVPETVTLLKSALMFTKKKLFFHIFTEPDLKDLFKQQFEKWPKYIQNKFDYSIMEPRFPSKNREEWKRLFKLCASQRIFLPDILKSVDSLLYVDTDVLFLSDLEEIWSHFEKFNGSQFAALSPEHEDPNMGWYNRFARHPYYGKLGLNSGVMLMNLTRMREFNFVDKFFPLYDVYKYNITWGDQCLLNILFHFHPERLYVYDCSWNYRPDHCMYGSNCKAAEQDGARILHGCRRVFHNDKELSFKAIYDAFERYDFSEESRKSFYRQIRDELETNVAIRNSYCGRSKDIFLKTLKKQLKRHKSLMLEEIDSFEQKMPQLESVIKLDL